MVNICLVGAAGRMGKNIASIVYNDKDSEIIGAIDRINIVGSNTPIYEYAGCGKGGVHITDNIFSASDGADVIIDFTCAEATLSKLKNYAEIGIPLIVGSTGFTPEQRSELYALGSKIALLISPNMSLGVNVMLKLAELASKSLKGYDIEIIETHHRMKKDAPSGTAIAIAEYAAKGAGLDLERDAVYCRHGIIGERKENEIGIQTIRGGSVAGDHTIFFFGNEERLEITHRASSRAVFAEGAVKAAKWLKGKPAGIYSMEDVLFC